jgi:lipopolysaccharide export system protein LptA
MRTVFAFLWLCLLSAVVSAADASASALSASTAVKALTGTAAAGGGSLPSTGATGTLREGFDEGRPVDIQGRRVFYRQADETLLAEGDVVLESAGARVYAERLWYDMKQGLLRAEGRVVVTESGNTLWAERVELRGLSAGARTGQAEELTFRQDPWTAVCGGAELLEGDVLVLRGCECSTCRQERPYWRLSAERLKIKAGDRFWAWGVLLHAGRVPVFWLPYYSQSLKDPRPPIEIKPGYSRQLGAYVRTKYNYYLGEGHYGSLRYDWMDKQGNGYGLGQHWRWKGGEGEAVGYMAVDKNDPSQLGWSATLSHRQALGLGMTFSGNLDLLSNEMFNEIYDFSRVDVYRRDSHLTLQRDGEDWSWSLGVGETQVSQAIPDGLGGVARRELVVSSRSLPSFSLTRYSRPLAPGSSLYGSLETRATRSLMVPQVLLTGTAAAVYDPAQAFMVDQVNLSPRLSHSLRLFPGLALREELNVEQSWRHVEGEQPEPQIGQTNWALQRQPSEWLSSGGGYLGLQARGGPWTFDVGHRLQRQFWPQAGLRWAGEIENRLTARGHLNLGAATDLSLSTDYDLRPWRTDSDLKRLGLLRLQVNASPNADRSAALSTSLHAPTGQFKTLDAWVNDNDPRKRWQLNLGLNWVNNRIVSVPPALDSSAPLELAFEEPRRTPDQLLASLRCTLALGPRWRLSFYERLDLGNRRVDEQAFALYRDFNCLDVDLYARQTLYGGWQFGFALSLRSVPQVRVNSNQVTADLFEPIQYGY